MSKPYAKPPALDPIAAKMGVVSTEDRLQEVAEILAAGFMRLQTRTYSPRTRAVEADNLLDIPSDRSVHSAVTGRARPHDR